MSDLESFTPCGTGSDCGGTVCSLTCGWVNLANGIDDDIDWRTNFGSTPSSGTGPSQDYNPGTSNGKYIYLEASNGCSGQVALLYSPCIDIPATGSFELTYRYHMDGINQGELHTDLIVDGELILDVIPPVIGDQGSSWNLGSVSITPYAGRTLVVRMRGITGSGFESDMALDNFKIQAPTLAPVVDFDVSTFSGCPGDVVNFVNTSSGAPNAFAWYVNPPTGWSYVNGTSSTSQHVSIQFNSTGSFTVGMTADNGVGVDSVGTVQAIEIGGLVLPFYEGFETSAGFDRFELNNPYGDVTWERETVDGLGSSWAVRMDNWSYNLAQSSEVEDWLTTPVLDFTTGSNAHLTFDHAYAGYSVSLYDSLAIFISTDCGSTWSRIASYDGAPGGNLETIGSQNTSFTPSVQSDWCVQGSTCTDIYLSAYDGFTDVQIRFIAKSGYGNNLYIDNINIGQPLPAASITSSSNDVCTGDVLTYSDGSGGAFQNYNWDFGSGATPATATGPGPHSVTYSTGGSKNVVLLADNGGASANANVSVQVTAPETAQFNVANPSVGIATFTPQANQANVDSVMWDFGDGSTSTVFPPSHTYNDNGSYSRTYSIQRVRVGICIDQRIDTGYRIK